MYFSVLFYFGIKSYKLVHILEQIWPVKAEPKNKKYRCKSMNTCTNQNLNFTIKILKYVKRLFAVSMEQL